MPSGPSEINSGASQVSHRPGGVLQTILYILLFPVYLLARLVPRDDRLFAFGSCHGKYSADNPKYLFLFASSQKGSFRCVYFTRNKVDLERLSAAGLTVHHPLSWKGILAAVRAGTCFISHSTHDIHPLLVGGAKIIQLWHGTPLKAIGYNVNLFGGTLASRIKYTVRSLLFRLLPYLNTPMNFTELVVASENVVESFRSAFRLNDSDICVLGQPRNDSLVPSYTFSKTVFPEMEHLEDWRSRFRFIVSWLPTHRLFSSGVISDVSGEFRERHGLQTILARHDTLLVIKDHYLDSRSLEQMFPEDTHIITYPFPDPYPLLAGTDILVTDYSSVYFDFLLLNRSIVFAPFVFDRGVRKFAAYYHRYEDVTPGPVCRDWPEVVAQLDRELTRLEQGKPDSFETERVKTCRFFNRHFDNYAKRVFERYFQSCLKSM